MHKAVAPLGVFDVPVERIVPALCEQHRDEPCDDQQDRDADREHDVLDLRAVHKGQNAADQSHVDRVERQAFVLYVAGVLQVLFKTGHQEVPLRVGERFSLEVVAAPQPGSWFLIHFALLVCASPPPAVPGRDASFQLFVSYPRRRKISTPAALPPRICRAEISKNCWQYRIPRSCFVVKYL